MSEHIGLDIQLTAGGLAKGLSNWQQYRRGIFPDYKLFQFFRGTGETAVDEHWHRHDPFDVVLIPAHRVIQHKSAGSIDLGWIHFRPLSSQFDALLAQIERPVIISQERNPLIDWNSLEGESLDTLSRWEIQTVVTQWALRALKKHHGNAHIELITDPDLVTVHRYIQRHYLERPSLELLASFISWSPNHLYRRYRQAYGHSPRSAVQYRLMNDVFKAICLERRTLDDCAEAFGFGDRFHVSKAIKKYFGRSVSELRKTNYRLP